MQPIQMRAIRLAIAVSVAFAPAAAVAHAQQPPSVLRLADGRQIYVFGLRRWTTSMIQDSLGKYSPGDSLQSHACAAALRYKLHFADAAASILRIGNGTPDIVFVSVREPQDSARVRYRPAGRDTTNVRPAWRQVTDMSRSNLRLLVSTYRMYLAPSEEPAPRFANARDSASARAAVAFLRARTNETDYRDALNALDRSPNIHDRTVAALILGNFPERSAGRAALFDTVRESDGVAKGVALEVLGAISRQSRSPWDWTALAPGVNAMLDGTSLFLLPDLIDLLNGRPEVGPAQARAFLRGGGEMLLDYVASDQPTLARPARSLLIKLRGADLGPNVDAWRAWIAAL
jgi:hypothetical protein